MFAQWGTGVKGTLKREKYNSIHRDHPQKCIFICANWISSSEVFPTGPIVVCVWEDATTLQIR